MKKIIILLILTVFGLVVFSSCLVFFDNGNILIYNESIHDNYYYTGYETITGIWIRSSDLSWGSNKIGYNYVDIGEYASLSVIPDIYDVRIEVLNEVDGLPDWTGYYYANRIYVSDYGTTYLTYNGEDFYEDWK